MKALLAGSTLEVAATVAKINTDTLLNWRKRYPDFDADVRQAQAQAQLNFESVIRDSARAGNAKAAMFWLEKRRPKIYGANAEPEPEPQVETGRLKLSKLSPEELKTLESLLAKCS